MYDCSFTLASSGISAALICCSSVRRRFRSITILWKKVSIGKVFSCRSALAGRSTSVPPRHLAAGATAVRPLSSRMMRRNSSSRSGVSAVTGGAILSRAETSGSGVRSTGGVIRNRGDGDEREDAGEDAGEDEDDDAMEDGREPPPR